MTGDAVKLVEVTIEQVASGKYQRRIIIVGQISRGRGESELNFLGELAEYAGVVLIYDPDTMVVELLRPTS